MPISKQITNYKLQTLSNLEFEKLNCLFLVNLVIGIYKTQYVIKK